MLPISALNAIEYCPRKFYYQFVQGEMLVNDLILEGTLAHERVHQAGTHTSESGEIETMRLYIYSEALHVSGFADVIEERAGTFVPVEYKHGRLGDWLNDHVQLCAQALCLEERMAGRPQGSSQHIPYGYIYYVGSRRRAKVHFTEQLRARTRETIAYALKVAAFKTPPPPLTGNMAARCPDCSLLPLCMPDEVLMLQPKKRR